MNPQAITILSGVLLLALVAVIGWWYKRRRGPRRGPLADHARHARHERAR